MPVSPQVLSVCSTQYKTVLDAIRAKKERFTFEEGEIRLVRTMCAFITMNPGYAGRAELPESLKALFRPVSMCVPDLNLIAEIMLLGEGFQQSKLLARKFIILYTLCEDLLSKQFHYDWKLRAIKTTLNVAGGMKRAAPQMTEDKVSQGTHSFAILLLKTWQLRRSSSLACSLAHRVKLTGTNPGAERGTNLKKGASL